MLLVPFATLVTPSYRHGVGLIPDVPRYQDVPGLLHTFNLRHGLADDTLNCEDLDAVTFGSDLQVVCEPRSYRLTISVPPCVRVWKLHGPGGTASNDHGPGVGPLSAMDLTSCYAQGKHTS